MTVLLNHQVDGPGAGHPLVLLGSLGSRRDMWRPNLPALTPAARVIRLDLPGHGHSPVPAGPRTVAAIAEDVLATLAELGVDRFDFCGLSLGGMVGMHLATHQPRRLRRLVLCSTSAGFADASGWAQRIHDVGQRGTAPMAGQIVTRWFTADWAAEHPAHVAEARSWVATTPVGGYLVCCQAIHDWDHRQQIGGITAPTLVLVGAEDPITPCDPHARHLADTIPGSTLITVPGSHLFNIESADVTNRHLAAHLID